MTTILMTTKTTALSSGTKDQASFEKNMLSEWMRSEKILVDYGNKNVEPQFTSMLVYLQAYMILKDLRASIFLLEET